MLAKNVMPDLNKMMWNQPASTFLFYDPPAKKRKKLLADFYCSETKILLCYWKYSTNNLLIVYSRAYNLE